MSVKSALDLGLMFELGWVVALSVLVPLAIGLWVDYRLSTSPLFILVGAAVGILGGTFGVVRSAVRVLDRLGQAPDAQSATEEQAVGKGDKG